MSDEREAERERWADRIDLEVRALRDLPDQHHELRVICSTLDEWANRIRFNEPDGNNKPRWADA